MSQVSAWVARFAPLVPAGEVLDLACGGGRHARHFLSLGHPVVALDRDTSAYPDAMQFDLEAPGMVWPFAPGRFAGIVVTNYLHRPLMAELVRALRPDGVLIYETFAEGNARHGKPSNPAFLLAPGELLQLPLRVIAYEDGETGSATVQRLCPAGPLFPVNRPF